MNAMDAIWTATKVANTTSYAPDHHPYALKVSWNVGKMMVYYFKTNEDRSRFAAKALNGMARHEAENNP